MPDFKVNKSSRMVAAPFCHINSCIHSLKMMCILGKLKVIVDYASDQKTSYGTNHSSGILLSGTGTNGQSPESNSEF